MSGDPARYARGYGATPLAGGLAYDARRNGVYVQAAPLGTSRSGMPDPKPYTWGGDPARNAGAVIADILDDPGAGWLLADSWDEPYEPPAADPQTAGHQAYSAGRRDRIEALAAMPLWHCSSTAPDGFITVRQAAGALGVSVRTVERYKRELRETGGMP